MVPLQLSFDLGGSYLVPVSGTSRFVILASDDATMRKLELTLSLPPASFPLLL